MSECPPNDMEVNIPISFSRERDYFTFYEEETFLDVTESIVQNITSKFSHVFSSGFFIEDVKRM